MSPTFYPVSIEVQNSDRGTTQLEWHVTAFFEGNPIEFFYLDAGNNARYDNRTELLGIEHLDEEAQELIERFCIEILPYIPYMKTT